MIGDMLAKGMNIRADIVPVIGEDDEDVLLSTDGIEAQMPVLPVMEQVLFPGVLTPIAARRPRSRQLLEDVSRSGRHLLVFAQKTNSEEPDENDLYPVGVVARVLKVFNFRQDTTVAILQGIVRCHSLVVSTYDPYMIGSVTHAPESDAGMQTEAFKKKVKVLRQQYAETMRSHSQDEDIAQMLANIGSDKIFINFAATNIDIDVEDKYRMLAADDYRERVRLMLEQLGALRGIDDLKREIDEKTRDVVERQQREYYLRNQLDVIQEELAGTGAQRTWNDPELEEMQKRAETKEWPEAAKQAFDKEMTKMSKIHPQSSDYTVQLGYLEAMLDLPWDHCVPSQCDIKEARKVLDDDHYGIEKVKDRVIEYLAVLHRQQTRKVSTKAQVLCLVGPPGTGKTSICRSVAAALKRPYRRMALGGLHDEAEIRGHRRTYVGAMPGRILQEITKAGASNPVFVLDEIDKVQTNTFHGDPSSALLEVLDPEQNRHFHDNFIGVDYDLSRVLFIATANSVADIQPALRDRMEIIDFSGYVMEEKVEIARRHLLPRIMKENVLDRRKNRFSDEIISSIIDNYTREGGVRQLEKQLSKLVRHRVVLQEMETTAPTNVTDDEVRQVLGLPIHNGEKSQREPREGVVTGLAWTPVGGEILFIESSLSHGKGTLTMTGNLGDVMKESATLAFEYLKANCEHFDIPYSTIEKSNLHIHVPEGATPKDGPSAGITMFVAMVSAFTHRRVLPNVAMTGEITLRGDVTPVGGIKEKILAAKRAGITDLILCHDNRRDIEDIEQRYLAGLTFHYIGRMDEALPLAMESKTKKNKSRRA
ncbi:MAG: endopeptidase La [Bacteroidales bacterium]|nr:endopeptidase La [Bacteroidales bacterium]